MRMISGNILFEFKMPVYVPYATTKKRIVVWAFSVCKVVKGIASIGHRGVPPRNVSTAAGWFCVTIGYAGDGPTGHRIVAAA